MRSHFKSNRLQFATLSLALVLMAMRCATSGNAIVPLPHDLERNIGVAGVSVVISDVARQSIISGGRAEDLRNTKKFVAIGILPIDDPLTPEGVQKIFTQQAQKDLALLGSNKLHLELLVTDMILPSSAGGESRMTVELSFYDDSGALRGKYRYKAKVASSAYPSTGIKPLDTALAVASAMSPDSGRDYVEGLVDDILDQIIRKHWTR